MLENKKIDFGPKKITLVDLLINSSGAFISGLIGSVMIIFLIFVVSFFIDLKLGLSQFNNLGVGATNPIFPFMLSVITFASSILVCLLTYYFLTLTDPNRYKKTIIHFGQISFFSIIMYILFAPVYILTGANSYDNMMYVFIIHSIFLSFGVLLLLELLNNYRYVLLGFYGSFFGLFMTGVIVFAVFFMFSSGYAKLLSLLFLLPLINGLIVFFKGVFEICYYQYFKITGYDQLGDIFRQIELEEDEDFKN